MSRVCCLLLESTVTEGYKKMSDTQKQSGSLITLGLKQHCTLFEFEVLKKVEGAPLQRRKSISVYLFAHLEILVNGGLLKRNCAASSLCDE